jgi:hypothetical protein
MDVAADDEHRSLALDRSQDRLTAEVTAAGADDHVALLRHLH